MNIVAFPDWEALGAAVKARREQLRLPQDLINHGGPGEMTVRKIERGEVTAIRNKTKTQLERALAWPDGNVDRILDGTAGTIPSDEAPSVRDNEDARALRIGHAVLTLIRVLAEEPA